MPSADDPYDGSVPRPFRVSHGVSAVLLATLATLAALAGCAGADDGTASSTTSSVPGATPSATSDAARTASAADVADVAELLNRRAAALVAGDEAAFAKTVADPQSSTGRRQLASYEAARSLGIDSLEVDQPVITGDHAQVDVRYRLEGLDRGDRVARLDYTVIRSGSGWAVVSERPTGGGATAPWVAMPDLRVQRGEHAVVAGTAPAADLAEYAAVVDRAVPDLRTRLGRNPGQGARARTRHRRRGRRAARPIGRPGTISRAGRGRGDHRGSHRSGRPSDGGPDRPGPHGIRPAHCRRKGRRAHPRARHVAVRATVPGAPATWLAEGYADHVGYSRAGLSDQRLLAPLLAEVRAGRVPGTSPATVTCSRRRVTSSCPTSPPGRRLSSSPRNTASRPCDGSWRPRPPPGPPPTQRPTTDAALVEVLGTSRSELTRVWQARLSRLAR